MLKASNRIIEEFKKGTHEEEEYIFIHGADPQLGFINEAAGGDGTKWDEELTLLKKAIVAVNKMEPKPKFFFLNGDLVHAFPGSPMEGTVIAGSYWDRVNHRSPTIQDWKQRQSLPDVQWVQCWYICGLKVQDNIIQMDIKSPIFVTSYSEWPLGIETGDHKKAQEEDLLKMLSTSTVPIMVSCGNHDIGNVPTTESVKNFTSLFGDDYYNFHIGNSFYIVLNSQYLFDPSAMKQQADKQMAWLQEQLNMAKSANYDRTIVFMHIPMFISTPDDEDHYTHLPKSIRHQLLDEFANAGVQYVFSGHYHRNGGGTWQKLAVPDKSGDKDLKVEVVVSSAIGMQLGQDKSGVTIVAVSKDHVNHKYFALEDIPSTFR